MVSFTNLFDCVIIIVVMTARYWGGSVLQLSAAKYLFSPNLYDFCIYVVKDLGVICSICICKLLY